MKSSILALVFIYLQFVLWFGEYGLYESLAMRNSISIQRQLNQQLLADTTRLQQKVKALQDTSEQPSKLREDALRWHLGFVKKEEYLLLW